MANRHTTDSAGAGLPASAAPPAVTPPVVLEPRVGLHPGRSAASTEKRRLRAAIHRAAHPEAYGAKPNPQPKQRLSPLHPGETRATPVHVRFKTPTGLYAEMDATQPLPPEVWDMNRQHALETVMFEAGYRLGDAQELEYGARLTQEAIDVIHARYCRNYEDYASKVLSMSPNARVKYAKAAYEYATAREVLVPPKRLSYLDVVLKFAKTHPKLPIFISEPPIMKLVGDRVPNASLISSTSLLSGDIPPDCGLIGEQAYERWSAGLEDARGLYKATVLVPKDSGFALEDFDEEQSSRVVGDSMVYQLKAQGRRPQYSDPLAALVSELGWEGPVFWKSEGHLDVDNGFWESPLREVFWDSRIVGHEVRKYMADRWHEAYEVPALHVLLRPRLRGGGGGRGRGAKPGGVQGRGRGRSGSNAQRTQRGGGAGEECSSSPRRGRGQAAHSRTVAREGSEVPTAATIPRSRGRGGRGRGRTTEQLVAAADQAVREVAEATIAAAACELECAEQVITLAARDICKHSLDPNYPSALRHGGFAVCSRGIGVLLMKTEHESRGGLEGEESNTRTKMSEAMEKAGVLLRDIITHIREQLLRRTGHSSDVLATALASTLRRFPGNGQTITTDLLKRVWLMTRRDLDDCINIEAAGHQAARVVNNRPAGAVMDPEQARTAIGLLTTASATREKRRMGFVTLKARVERWYEEGVSLMCQAGVNLLVLAAATTVLGLAWRRWRTSLQIAAIAGPCTLAAASVVGSKLQPTDKPRRLGPEHAALFEQHGTFFEILPTSTNLSICLGQPPRPDPTDPKCPVDPAHTIKTWPKIEQCDREDQDGGDLFGPAFCWAQVARSCLCNSCNALVNRHASRRPVCLVPLSATWDRYDKALARRVRATYSMNLIEAEEKWFDWLSSVNGAITLRSKWPVGTIIKLWRSIMNQPSDPSRTAGFNKREIGKACYDHWGLGALMRSRLIHPYLYDAAKEIMGREFAAWQRSLFGVLSPLDPYEYSDGIHVSIGCGVGKGDIASWAERTGAVWWMESDASSWDAFVNQGMIQYKHLHMEVVDTRIADFAKRYVRTPVVVYGRDQKLEYELVGTVRSGYNCTTSGNSLMNAMVTAKAMMRAGLRGHILVAGDDMLTGITGRANGTVDFTADEVIGAATAVAENLSSFGIKPKWGAFWDVTQTTFCSGGFYRFGASLNFLPLLGRQLAKLWWTTKHIALKNRLKYATGVRKCMLSVVGRVPVYREWVGLAGMEGSPIDPGGLAELEREMGYKPGPGVADTAQFTEEEAYTGLADRYGLTTAELKGLADFFNTLPKNTPCAVGHPIGRLIVETDALDPGDRPYRIQCS